MILWLYNIRNILDFQKLPLQQKIQCYATMPVKNAAYYVTDHFSDIKKLRLLGFAWKIK